MANWQKQLWINCLSESMGTEVVKTGGYNAENSTRFLLCLLSCYVKLQVFWGIFALLFPTSFWERRVHDAVDRKISSQKG